MKYTYVPEGVCSRQIELDIEDGIVKTLKVIGGCDGNLQGIAKLVKGMKVEDVIERLKGIDCRRKRNIMPRSNSKGIRKHICKYIITLYLEYKVPKSDVIPKKDKLAVRAKQVTDNLSRDNVQNGNNKRKGGLYEKI